MAKYEYRFKKTKEEIRASIDLEKKEWLNIHSTNCYAYALGLDINESDIEDYAYSPGTIGKSKIFLPDQRIYTYKTLLDNMYLDFEALGINYSETNPLDKIKSDEWKIALFITTYCGAIDDFHFLRQHKDGLWYHKEGYIGPVENVDSHRKIITNPKECKLTARTYKKCLKLRLK